MPRGAKAGDKDVSIDMQAILMEKRRMVKGLVGRHKGRFRGSEVELCKWAEERFIRTESAGVEGEGVKCEG